MRSSFGWLGKVCFWASAFSHLSSLQGQAQSWQFYQAPGTNSGVAMETSFEDIDGTKFVGRQNPGIDEPDRGIIYDSATASWTTLHKAGAYATTIFSKDGSIFVGEYANRIIQEGSTNFTFHGFLSADNGNTLHGFDLPDVPQAASSILYGVRGSKLTGTYYTNSVTSPNGGYFDQRTHDGGRGFVHDLSTGTTRTFAISNAITTQAVSLLRGSSNNVVVGTAYFEISGALTSKAFIYDLDSQSETLLQFGEAEFTTFFAGEGGRFVGAYRDDFIFEDPIDGPISSYNIKGLLYDQTTQTWASLEAPGAYHTWANSIHGDTIVGTSFYVNLAGAETPDPDDWAFKAFVYTVPEPGSTGLAALGLGTLLMRKRRGRR